MANHSTFLRILAGSAVILLAAIPAVGQPKMCRAAASELCTTAPSPKALTRFPGTDGVMTDKQLAKECTLPGWKLPRQLRFGN